MRLSTRSHLPALPGLLGLSLSLSLALAACGGGSRTGEMTEEQELELYITTATYLYEDGSHLRAQDQAVKALEIEPENRPMRRMVGWIRLHQGEVNDLVIAERLFRELLEDGDGDETSSLGLATAVERLGVAHDARSRAIAAAASTDAQAGSGDPARARELSARARDLWAEAIVHYERTLSGGEGSTRAMNGLQRTHALLGDYDESLRWARSLLTRSQEELGAWRRLLTDTELTEREEELLRTNEQEAVTLQRDTLIFTTTLLRRIGRDQEALEHIDTLIALGDTRPEFYSLRAQLRSAVGDPQGAIEDLDRYLRLSDQPFEHPDVQRAFDLRKECEEALAELAGG